MASHVSKRLQSDSRLTCKCGPLQDGERRVPSLFLGRGVMVKSVKGKSVEKCETIDCFLSWAWFRCFCQTQHLPPLRPLHHHSPSLLYPRAISDTLPLCLYFCSHRISPHNHWGPKRKSPRLSKPQIYSLPRVAEAPVMSYQVQPKSSMLGRRQSTSERLTLHLWYAMHLNDSALKK